MQLGSIVLASIAGMVGLVAGRVTSPAPAVVIAATPAPIVRTVNAPPVVPVREEDDVVDDTDGIDIADAIAQAKAEIAAQPVAAIAHGLLEGTLQDSNGEAAVGATVVVNGPAMQGEQVVITDETGKYMISNLPAGYYTMTVYFNDMTTTRDNVMVSEYTPQTNSFALNAWAPPKGETVVIDEAGDPPITIDKDYIEEIPVPGRTFEMALGAAASSDHVIGIEP